MKTNISLLKSLISIFALLFISAQSVAGTVVIVSADSNTSSMSSSEVKAAYLGKGKKFKTIALSDSTAIHKDFMSKVIRKSESQFKAYWSKKIFSGKGSPPKVVDSAEMMKSSVASSNNAIGYIDSSQLDGSVKVVYSVE